MKLINTSGFFCAFIVLFASSNAFASPNIVLSLRRPPLSLLEETESSNHLPSEMSKTMLENYMYDHNAVLPPLSGFLATYAGYVAISHAGIITFPLRHTSPKQDDGKLYEKLYILISPKPPKLIKLSTHTFAYQTVEPSAQDKSMLYLFEKQLNSNDIPYWKVQKTSLPDDGILSPLTVTFITNPKALFISEGDFMATASPDMILPRVIYVVDLTWNPEPLARTMDVMRYFEQIQYEHKNGEQNLKLMQNK